MRLAARWLLFVVLAAGAFAAVVLFSQDRTAVLALDHVANDLCIVAPATPHDPASATDLRAPMAIPAAARCPVCGMYPVRYPRWAAQVRFRDGAAHFFDSPVDLFAFLQRVERHDRRYTATDVAVSFVTDFATGQWTGARHAYFVAGSSLLGPMRAADLPAFARRASAEALVRQRGGRVLAYAEITPALIRSLNRNLHHRH